MRRASWLTLLLAFFVAPAAAEVKDIARGPSREPLPHRYDPKLVSSLPRAYFDEVPAATLYAGTSYILEPDGTLEAITHEITRFNGRKGIEQWGEFRGIVYDPHYQKLTLNEARVLKKDGRVVPIEPRHLQLRDESTDFTVYGSDKVLVISFPGLEVGDAYEVKWTLRGKNPEFDGRFFTRYTFGDDAVPVALDELHVVVPRGSPFHHTTINGKLEPTKRAVKGGTHYHWQARDRWPRPREEDRPSRELLRLQVACSTFADWKEVAAWKEKRRADCWECTKEVRDLVRQLTRDLTDPRDKARTLTYWVRQNVRYLSRGFAGKGYTPHPPHQVLQNLFGDCKDQAQLLAVMLREVGLDPWLVTLGMLDDGQVLEDNPSPWGTHGILMVPIDGKEHWIDTTANMAPWDWLPRVDRDRLCYLTRRGEILLKKTPPYTALDNRIEQTTVIAVQGDGTSLVKRSMFFHGGMALGRRESWVEATPGEKRRMLTSEVQDAYPRSILERLEIPEAALLNWDRPVEAQLAFTIPRHFLGEGGKEASVTDSPVWGRILAYVVDKDRTLALNLGSPFESLHLHVIQLPPAYRFDGLPRDRSVDSPWGTFRLTVQPDARNPRRLELVMHTKLKTVLIEPADFDRFRKFHDELSRAYRVWLNIRPTSEIEDAPLLETLLAVAPGSDAVAVKTLARLYLDHARPDEARRVLDDALGFHAGDQDLWELRLKAARNLDDTESVLEALSRLAPHAPEHALRLGATRIQREHFSAARKTLVPLTRHAARDIRARAFYQLALMQHKQGQLGPALLNFEAAWHTDQAAVATAAAMLFAGRLHEGRGDAPEALKAYALAHKLEPDSTDALLALVRLQVRLGKRDEALAPLRRLAFLAQGDVSGLIQVAEIYHQLGRHDEAHELAEQARATGYQGRVQRLLGLLHLQKGDFARAAFHLERGDIDAPALEALIQAYLAMGSLQEAHRQLDAIARLGIVPASLRAWEAEVNALAARYKSLIATRPDPGKPPHADLQQAVQHYLCADLALRKAKPREHVRDLLAGAFRAEVGPAYALRALLSLEQGQLRRAWDDVDRAFQLGPPESRAFCVRGRIRLEKGDNGAIDDLTRAAALSRQEDPHVLHWLAAALHQAGRLEEALAVQRRAVELAPGDRDLADQLSALERARH